MGKPQKNPLLGWQPGAPATLEQQLHVRLQPAGSRVSVCISPTPSLFFELGYDGLAPACISPTPSLSLLTSLFFLLYLLRTTHACPAPTTSLCVVVPAFFAIDRFMVLATGCCCECGGGEHGRPPPAPLCPNAR
jgi:hypothetical protein